jgi:DUF1680 family protein
MHALDLIWNDVVQKKMYIAGACGALYDRVSPDGTSYNPAEIRINGIKSDSSPVP